MFGNGQVETDTFLRTLGWRQTAEAEWEQMGPESKAILQAYTDGVNAYLKDHNDTALSLEYAVLGLLSPDYEIEEWTPVHSLTWGKAMAWDLRGNMDEGNHSRRIAQNATPEQVNELYPPYPSDHPVIVNKIGDGASQVDVQASNARTDYQPLTANLEKVSENIALLNPLLGELSGGIGSNSWVVSGQLTDTGHALARERSTSLHSNAFDLVSGWLALR